MVGTVQSEIEAPRPRLGIGLTGHRLDRLGRSNVASTAAALADALLQIERAAPWLNGKDFRLVTGLADGADSIGADLAIDRGWTVDVILPFFREQHQNDFHDPQTREAFARQLQLSDSVMELDGGGQNGQQAEKAYEQAGLLTLAQCDILIAVWDGKPGRGRGGAPHVVAHAVLEGIPVIHIDPAAAHPPRLLWDGLSEVDLGQQTIDTVERGSLDELPRLVRSLTTIAADERREVDRFQLHRHRRWTAMVAYPLMLAAFGVRRLRRSDFGGGPKQTAGPRPVEGLCASATPFGGTMQSILERRFAHADAAATRLSQLYRSGFVTNFLLAAAAVILSLAGLALPSAAKPVLLVLEVAAIAAILILTLTAKRADWHRRWLDSRAIAERLRSLSLSAQLGDLELRPTGGRAPRWTDWYVASIARAVGLPNARIDADYLACVRSSLLALIDSQIGYLATEQARMHRLEHRLHILGTIMFALTAFACLAVLALKIVGAATGWFHAVPDPIILGATILGAALPAIGAAIYGIRMQGDFAGTAVRDRNLADALGVMRAVIVDDDLSFDTLRRRTRRVSALLIADVGSWLQTYDARPLSLPG